jgi:peptidoglycan/xylan/chitin deacetylase (PgdA/CDA1 family)
MHIHLSSSKFNLVVLFIALCFSSNYMQALAVTPNCNCVVFRLDDIQDYWITPAQTAVMDVFKGSNLPISVGIIANYFGTDATIVNYIKTGLQDTAWDFEVANHGWNHEYFSTFTLAEQETLMSESRTKMIADLSPYLTSSELTTIIMPYNDMNADTLTACKANGFTAMSSETDIDLPPYAYDANEALYRWPINAATSDMSIEDYMIGIPAAQTFTEIQNQINQYGFAAVMMHPQEFCILDSSFNPTETVDTNQVNQLVQLIQMVQNAGIKMVTFKELKNQFGQQGLTTGKTNISVTTGISNSPLTTGKSNSPLTTGISNSPLTTGKSNSPLTTGKANTPSTTGSASTTTCTPGWEICSGTSSYQTCLSNNVYGADRPCQAGLVCKPWQTNYVICDRP